MSYLPTIVGSGPGAYAFLDRTRARQQDLFEQSPAVARETDAARKGLAQLQTSDELLDNRMLLKVALGAFGLDEDIDNRAFLKKVLDSDLKDSKSFANRLADKRYLHMARTFDFAGGTGPTLLGGKSADDVSRELANVRSADDLLSNRTLLRATLATFGLERDIDNTFFLESVLNSDPADPASFAGRLGDPAYVDLARALDLSGKAAQRDSMYGFADLFEGRAAGIATFDDLAAAPELLDAALDIFGIDGAKDSLAELKAIMSSDPADPAAAVNLRDDTRYLALTRAFGFADRAAADASNKPFTSRLEKFVATVASRDTPIDSPQAFFQDIRLMLDTFDFFDFPQRPDRVAFANRVLESDGNSPTSLVNVFPDGRVRAFADAIGLGAPEPGRVTPPGFAEAIVETYLARQFEVAVGETDPTLRFAMSLERELKGLVDSTRGNDSRWFGVMASKPLREVFETVFRLPTSFGTLDVDRQLGELKSRAKSILGTDQIADLLSSDRLADLRRGYLVQSSLRTAPESTAGSIAMTLLANAGVGARGLLG